MTKKRLNIGNMIDQIKVYDEKLADDVKVAFSSLTKESSRRTYRVWYRTQEDGIRSFNKRLQEVNALSVVEAKKLVEEMFPGSKATSAWLLKK